VDNASTNEEREDEEKNEILEKESHMRPEQEELKGFVLTEQSGIC